jgi:hypothetical protein
VALRVKRSHTRSFGLLCGIGHGGRSVVRSEVRWGCFPSVGFCRIRRALRSAGFQSAWLDSKARSPPIAGRRSAGIGWQLAEAIALRRCERHHEAIRDTQIPAPQAPVGLRKIARDHASLGRRRARRAADDARCDNPEAIPRQGGRSQRGERVWRASRRPEDPAAHLGTPETATPRNANVALSRHLETARSGARTRPEAAPPPPRRSMRLEPAADRLARDDS